MFGLENGIPIASLRFHYGGSPMKTKIASALLLVFAMAVSTPSGAQSKNANPVATVVKQNEPVGNFSKTSSLLPSLHIDPRVLCQTTHPVTEDLQGVFEDPYCCSETDMTQRASCLEKSIEIVGMFSRLLELKVIPLVSSVSSRFGSFGAELDPHSDPMEPLSAEGIRQLESTLEGSISTYSRSIFQTYRTQAEYWIRPGGRH